MKKLLSILLIIPSFTLAQITNKCAICSNGSSLYDISAPSYSATVSSGAPGFYLNQGARYSYNMDSGDTVYTTYNGSNYFIHMPSGKGFVFDVNGSDVFTISAAGAITTGSWNGTIITVPYGGSGAGSLTGLLNGNGTSAYTAITTSNGLASVISDETGSDALVFATAPALSGVTAFSLDDSDSAFNLSLASTSTLTQARTLTFDVDNGSRTLRMNGNLTLGGTFITSGSSSLTLTTTSTTNVTLPTTGTLATLDGTESLTNKTLGANSQFTILRDVSANEMLFFTPITNADDWWNIQNATGGSSHLVFEAAGVDTSISVDINAKGTGNINLGGDVLTTGGVAIGGGDNISSSYQRTVTVDIANIPANTCLDTLVNPVTGCATNSPCQIGALPVTANIIFECMCSTTNQAIIRACNPTVGAINPASQSYQLRTFNP